MQLAAGGGQEEDLPSRAAGEGSSEGIHPHCLRCQNHFRLLHSCLCCHFWIPHSHHCPKQYCDQLPRPTTQYKNTLNKTHFDRQGDAVPCYVMTTRTVTALVPPSSSLHWSSGSSDSGFASVTTSLPRARAGRLDSSVDFVFFHERVPKWFKRVLQNFGVGYLYISPDKVGHVEIHLPLVCLPSRLDKGNGSW